jgi:hypothetical protein
MVLVPTRPEPNEVCHSFVLAGMHTGTSLSLTNFESRSNRVKLRPKYKIVIEALVRDYNPIKYRKWNGKDNDRWRVPESEKDDIWENKIPQYFTFPQDYDKEQVKKKSKRNHCTRNLSSRVKS